MFPDKPELTITIPSKTELLKLVVELTRHVAILNNFTESLAQKMSLAVDEAITNVIKHSYEYREDEEIKIDFFYHKNGIKIAISYRGIAPEFAERNVDLNTMIKEKKKGGLGVELMRRIMDSVNYSTENGLNVCEMVKWKK